MPAPAVIPAPRAYINAVAVKGFVVELRAGKKSTSSNFFELGPLLFRLVNIRNNYHGIDPPRLRAQCAQGGVRGLTVTKKM